MKIADLKKTEIPGITWKAEVELCGRTFEWNNFSSIGERLELEEGNKRIKIREGDKGVNIEVRFDIGYNQSLWNYKLFDILDEAAGWALSLELESIESAGVPWHRLPGKSTWTGVFSKGDTGEIYCNDSGEYSVKRQLRNGNESFELEYHVYDQMDKPSCQITDFDIAARKCAGLFAGLDWVRTSFRENNDKIAA